MAEGGTFTSLSFEEDILCCSICMEEYEDPRALPCLHTFCYKCLVQIDESSGDTSRRIFLKCPLCAELHQIPKETGVAGFRKDFRIKNLIDHSETKSPVAVSSSGPIPRDVSEEEITSSDVDSESCSVHSGERLMYFCESSSCQKYICEKCWSSDHDTHSVKLLSKKISDARDAVQQQMGKTIEKINSQINILINGSEKMTNQYEEAMINLRMKAVKMEEKLECSVQKVCNTLQESRKAEEQKMADELQKLCALQDTFVELKDSLEKENLPHTSKAFNKYALMNEKLHQLTTGLDEWNITYTTVNVPELKISAAFEEAVEAELKVEENTEITLGTKPQESNGNMSGKNENDGGVERWEEILKEDLKDQTDAEPRGESKQEGLYKLPGKEKPVVSKTWALQKGVDVLTGVQKGFRLFHGIQKGLVKGIQKGFQAGAKKPPRKEAEKKNAEVKKTIRIEALRWEEFAVKNMVNIEGMASSGNGVLLKAAQNRVISYDTFSIPPQKIHEGPLPGSEAINAITVASSPRHNTKVIATLDCKKKLFTLHTLGNLHLHDQPLPRRTSKTIASSGPFLGITYNVGTRSNVGVYSIDQDENEITCKEEAQIPFKYGRIRSLSMLTSPDGERPVFIGACVFIPGKSEKSEVALVALTLGEEELWSLTFDDIDPNTTNFDLRGVVCDNENVFVLNNKLNVVYYVSNGGKCVKTLSFLDTPPLFHFAAPWHICLDWDKKSLYITHQRDVVSRFTLA